MLGHVNLDACREERHRWTIDNSPLSPIEDVSAQPADTVELFHMPVRIVDFKHDEKVVRVSYLVTTAEVPEWVWRSGKAVKFSSESWKEIL